MKQSPKEWVFENYKGDKDASQFCDITESTLKYHERKGFKYDFDKSKMLITAYKTNKKTQELDYYKTYKVAQIDRYTCGYCKNVYGKDMFNFDSTRFQRKNTPCVQCEQNGNTDGKKLRYVHKNVTAEILAQKNRESMIEYLADPECPLRHENQWTVMPGHKTHAGGHNSQPVRINGVEFESFKDAAKCLKLSFNTVHKRVKSDRYPKWCEL